MREIKILTSGEPLAAGTTSERYDLVTDQILPLRFEQRALMVCLTGHFLVYWGAKSESEPLRPCDLFSVAAESQIRVQCLEGGALSIVALRAAVPTTSKQGTVR